MCALQERSSNEQAVKEAFKRFKKEASPYDKLLVSGRRTKAQCAPRLLFERMRGRVHPSR